MVSSSSTGAQMPLKSQKDYFVAGMLFRIHPTQGVQFLVIKYQQGDYPKQYKFPGGTNKISKVPLVLRTDEDPITTLVREYRVEVGYQLKGLYPSPLIIPKEGRNDGEIHYKNFFLVDLTQVEGELREKSMVEKELGSKDEYLDPPEWVSPQDLLRGQFAMPNDHVKAMQAAMRGIETVKSKADSDDKDSQLACTLQEPLNEELPEE